ncbi:MAG: murein transglycosylase [Alphaproteobacteria bacterium]|nr:murein transglycosylase [Alphaproteobacteria bacterium]
MPGRGTRTGLSLRRVARTRLSSIWIAAAALLALGACDGAEVATPEHPADTAFSGAIFTAVDFDDLPGWRDDALGEAVGAFVVSCAKFDTLPADRALGPDPRSGRVGDWQLVCDRAQDLSVSAPAVDDGAARALFENQFRPYRVASPHGGSGKFTGYYEAELRGARARSGRYRVPIYGPPDDLVAASGGAAAAVPYADRNAIEAGYLDGRDLELLWVDDPVDAFVLHIQGSGRVILDDGTVVRVGYAGNNGHGFVAIGRLMLDRGLIGPEDANMPAIRAWLRANPVEARLLMAENPRYIFFREIVGAGPIGAQGVALTPARSLAVDRAFLPLGAPLWLDTTWPGEDGKPLRRLMVAQDTGSAITGAVRGDFYWGSGAEAFELAGRMNQPGAYYILLPIAVAERLEPTS